MRNSWINKLLAVALSVLFFVGPASLAQESEQVKDKPEAEAAGEVVAEVAGEKVTREELDKAMALGVELEKTMRLLRAYQPGEALDYLDQSKLPTDLANLFRGWAWHQHGDYKKAGSFFKDLEPETFKDNPYLAGRLAELKKTAEELVSFERLETKTFSIRYKPGADEVLLSYLPDVLEQTYSRFSTLFNFTVDHKIVVELMPDHRLFSYASALTREQIETTGTIALCVENRLVILTPRRVLMGYYWPDVIAHEFVHYILTKKSRDNAPLWMQEGVAKFFEARWELDQVNPLDPGMETAMARAVKSDSLLTVQQMMPSFAALPTAELARQAYAQTTTMIDYLASVHGEQVVDRIVTALGEDGDLNAVMEKQIGRSFDDFEQDWRLWLKDQNYKEHGAASEAHGVTLLDSDQPAEEELGAVDEELKKQRKHVRLGDLLLERNRYRAALGQFEKLPPVEGRIDRQVLLRKLFCHDALGQHQHIVELIDTQTQDLQNDVTMLLKKADAQIALQNTADARGLLERSIRINPFNPRIFELLLSLDPSEEEARLFERCLDKLKNPGAAPGKDRKS